MSWLLLHQSLLSDSRVVCLSSNLTLSKQRNEFTLVRPQCGGSCSWWCPRGTWLCSPSPRLMGSGLCVFCSIHWWWGALSCPFFVGLRLPGITILECASGHWCTGWAQGQMDSCLPESEPELWSSALFSNPLKVLFGCVWIRFWVSYVCFFSFCLDFPLSLPPIYAGSMFIALRKMQSRVKDRCCQQDNALLGFRFRSIILKGRG